MKRTVEDTAFAMSLSKQGVTPDALASRVGMSRGHAYNTLRLMEKRGEVHRKMTHMDGRPSIVTDMYLAGDSSSSLITCKKDTLLNFGGTEEEAVRRIAAAIIAKADTISTMPDWLHVDVEIDDVGIHMHLSTTFQQRRLSRSVLYWTTRGQVISIAENLALDESDAIASVFFGTDVYDHMVQR